MPPIAKQNGEPYRLMTVNKVPERAFRLVGRVAAELKSSDQLLLEHVGNAATLEEVEGKVQELRPDILMCASMWTPAESSQVFETGRRVIGDDLITHAIPQGLQVEKGPDAVVEYLVETLPRVVRGEGGSGGKL